MLYEIIGTIGFILLILGAGGIESHSMAVPAIMTLSGLGILYWFACESGIFNE